MSEETASEFLIRLGIDGKLWAEEFVKKYPDVPLDIATAWFSNAIMAGYDRGWMDELEAKNAKQEAGE